MANEGLRALDKHMGAKSKVNDGTDPDEPGAKVLYPYLRYSYKIEDEQAPDGYRIIEERLMDVPRWRVVEMLNDNNPQERGRVLSEEEATPVRARQKEEDLVKADIAHKAAALFLSGRRQELGEVPDVVDPETAARMNVLEEKMKEQDTKLDAIINLLKDK